MYWYHLDLHPPHTHTGENLQTNMDIVQKMMAEIRSVFPVVGYALGATFHDQIGFVIASTDPVSEYNIGLHHCTYKPSLQNNLPLHRRTQTSLQDLFC